MTMLNTGQQPRVTRSPMRFGAVAGVLIAGVVLAGCGDDDNNEMSAEFTGDDCVYAGPTDFEVGDEFELRVSDVTEERMDVGFAVRKVADGTSATELREKGIFAVNEGEAAALVFSAVTEEGTERVMTGTLDVAGTWVVNCFSFGAAEEDFPALIFEVVEES